jgi:hypothetical protein
MGKIMTTKLNAATRLQATAEVSGASAATYTGLVQYLANQYKAGKVPNARKEAIKDIDEELKQTKVKPAQLKALDEFLGGAPKSVIHAMDSAIADGESSCKSVPPAIYKTSKDFFGPFLDSQGGF